jgi:hypothetical protein
LTGTEVGVAAATAFLNQKLLGALFGEAAMVELIDRARARLDATLAAAFREERERFETLLPPPDSLATLLAALRKLGEELGQLPSGAAPTAEPANAPGAASHALDPARPAT